MKCPDCEGYGHDSEAQYCPTCSGTGHCEKSQTIAFYFLDSIGHDVVVQASSPTKARRLLIAAGIEVDPLPYRAVCTSTTEAPRWEKYC